MIKQYQRINRLETTYVNEQLMNRGNNGWDNVPMIDLINLLIGPQKYRGINSYTTMITASVPASATAASAPSAAKFKSVR